MGGELTDEQILELAANWFTSFAAQTVTSCTLGEGTPVQVLGGGRSGATVIRVLAGDYQNIVIKRAALSKVVAEAKARRMRVERGYASESEATRFQTLRRRGASHVSIDEPITGFDPAPDPELDPGERLYGVIAYEYTGPDAQLNAGRTSFEAYVRDETRATAENFQTAVEAVLKTLFKPHQAHNDGEVFRGEPVEVDGKPTRLTKTGALVESIGLGKKWEKAMAHSWGDAMSEDDMSLLRSLKLGWSTVLARRESTDFQDSRLVHGDPRLANIFVNPAQLGEPDIIDYGDGGPGRHLFHDLVRLETDLLFRVTRVGEGDGLRKADEVDARAQVLYGPQLARDAPGDRLLAITHHWRSARDEVFPQLARARALYWLFQLTELLRRLTWHIPDEKTGVTNSDADVGATVPEIMTALRVLTAAENVAE